MSRTNYAKISLQKRQSLVKMVIEEQMSIAKAGRKLLIRPSTAKLIVRKYRQTGCFFVKKRATSQQQEVQNVDQLNSGNSNLVNGTHYINSQQSLFAESNGIWNYNYALGSPQCSYYLVYPLNHSNLVVYY